MEKVVRVSILACFFLLSAISIVFSFTPETIALPEEAVAKKILDNGLTILSKYSLPDGLVSIDVKVQTGSSLEGEYLGSGISHLVEHMVFKGTAKRGVGSIEKEVKSYGGIINGSTSQDVTSLYIIIPARYLPQALDILKDMLLNARMDPSELAKEKTVILKEMRMNQDEPNSRLMRLLNETAYLEHPYRYPAIGYEENLKALSVGDILNYYNTRYVPNRMIVTVVGGLDSRVAIASVEDTFKDFRSANYGLPRMTSQEPIQIQRRRADERMETSLSYLAMGFHSTSIASEDLFAMDVLAMVLARGDNSRLNSVLYKEKELVHTITAWNHTPRDPGLFVITAVLDEKNIDNAERAVMTELDLLCNGLVRDDELYFAKRALLSDLTSTLETVEGQTDDISTGYSLTGSEDFTVRYMKGVNAVTGADIKAVADRYLRADNLTTVTIRGPDLSEKKPVATAAGAKENVIESLVLPNGIKLFVRQDNKVPTVTITAAVRGGYSAETPEDNGISSLTADMLLRGTEDRPDSGKIKGKIEELGGKIESFSGANTCGVSISVLRPDMDMAIETLKEIMTKSAFPEPELEKSMSVAIAGIKSEDDDIFEVGMNKVREELFSGSPYGLRSSGNIRSVSALRRDDIVDFYNRHYVSGDMVIAVSGDVNTNKTISRLKDLFSDVKSQPSRVTRPNLAAPIEKGKVETVIMEKEQSLLMLGFRSVPRNSPDRYALEALGAVMSGSSGRLFDELRSSRSLAYALGCSQDFWTDEGMLVFYIATTKAKLPEARSALTNELRRLKASGVSISELSQAKSELAARHQMAMQSNAFFTLNFAVEELRGLGYDNLYSYESELNKVTGDDIKRVAGKYIDFDRCVDVTVSPKL